MLYFFICLFVYFLFCLFVFKYIFRYDIKCKLSPLPWATLTAATAAFYSIQLIN